MVTSAGNVRATDKIAVRYCAGRPMPRRQPTPGPGDYQPEIWTGAPIKKGPHPPINVTDYKGPQNAYSCSGLSRPLLLCAAHIHRITRWPDALQYELPKRSSRKPPPFEVGYGDSRATAVYGKINWAATQSYAKAHRVRLCQCLGRPPQQYQSRPAIVPRRERSSTRCWPRRKHQRTMAPHA